MTRFVLLRLGRLLLSIVVVSILTFALLKSVPGSFTQLAQSNIGIGLDQTSGGAQSGDRGPGGYQEPAAWVEYLTFMKDLVTWNLPYTYKYPQLTIGDVISQGFPITFTIAVAATLLTLLMAIPAGLAAALFKDSWLDRALMVVSTMATALPGYLLVLIMVLVFASWLKVLPTGGWDSPVSMVIPVGALAIEGVAPMARYVRSSVLEQLREEYVVAALAKGGVRRTVMVRHVLRNSLVPLVTVAGPYFATLLTGTVFIEALLRIPGLGLYFATAAQSRDMPLLMGSTLFFALLLVVMNMLVDISYRVLDPRVRFQSPVATFSARRAARLRLKEVAARG